MLSTACAWSKEGKGTGSGVLIVSGSMDRGRFSLIAVVLYIGRPSVILYTSKDTDVLPTFPKNKSPTITGSGPVSRAQTCLHHLLADVSQAQQPYAKLTPCRSTPTLGPGLAMSKHLG
jgi:hypothetical protein